MSSNPTRDSAISSMMSLDEALPFHVVVDRELKIRRAGMALRVFSRRLIGRPLTEVFALRHAGLTLERGAGQAREQIYGLLARSTQQVVTLDLEGGAADGGSLRLVGPLVGMGDAGDLAFLVVPAPSAAPETIAAAAPAAEPRSHEGSNRLQAALLDLAMSHAPDLRTTLEEGLKVDAQLLDVARVSYWTIVRSPVSTEGSTEGSTEVRAMRADEWNGAAVSPVGSIRCELLYVKTFGQYESGAELSGKEHRGYFDALSQGMVIAASNAHQDPRTNDLSASYLGPLGIGAMLVMPVYVRGELCGVICHEHVGGDRTWTVEEQQFAMSIAQVVAQAIDEQSMRDSEVRLKRVMETTLDAVVTVTDKGVVKEWNAHAEELFGWPRQAVIGRRVIDTLVPPGSRESAEAALRELTTTRHAGLLDRRMEVVALHRDGRELAVQIAVTSMTVSNRVLFSAFVRPRSI